MQSGLVNFVLHQVLFLFDAEIEIFIKELRGGGSVVEVSVDESALSAA